MPGSGGEHTSSRRVDLSMKFVRIDPPGSWCQYRAFDDMTRGIDAKTFVDVGCGAGGLSLMLCKKGLVGAGVDFSERAVAEARENLKPFIDAKTYTIACGDVADLTDWQGRADLACSMMVMEHVEDDAGFLRKMIAIVRPGGHVVVGVPARMDKWGPEDETVGHLRRYESAGLKNLMEDAGLSAVRVWSLAVPVANALHGLGNFFLRRSGEMSKKEKPLREQTETSGIRAIPFKTVFPAWFGLILNQWTMTPFFLLQRLFYRSNKGLAILAMGRKALVPHPGE